jgi:hypothetical protein
MTLRKSYTRRCCCIQYAYPTRETINHHAPEGMQSQELVERKCSSVITTPPFEEVVIRMSITHLQALHDQQPSS